jgi:hypothetical protein
MFEVDGEYENRIGKYTVLAIAPPKMQVRYHNGKHAELNMEIQGRIWENILVEKDARGRGSRNVGDGSSKIRQDVRYFIKVVSLPAADEMLFPGWHERVVMVPNPIQAKRIGPGDRVIYYGQETDTFFAVSTITGSSFDADPKEYFFGTGPDLASFFPVDVDVTIDAPDKGVLRAGVDLDDYRDFEQLLGRVEAMLPITEDDFEMLAELLTEMTEVDDDGNVEDEIAEEDE